MKKIIYYFTFIGLIFFIKMNPIKCQSISSSMINIYIQNWTLKTNVPIDIWFNDSLVISEKVNGEYHVRYRMFSKGNLKISAQIRGYNLSRTEYAINVLNDSEYNIEIIFNDTYAKTQGSILRIKSIDGKYYEPYIEENIVDLVNESEAISNTSYKLADTNINYYYSENYFLLEHFGSTTSPIKIWLDDELIISKQLILLGSYSSIYCRLLTKNKIKISAQFGDSIKTKVEKELDISDKTVNFIKIYYNISDKGSITMLDQEQGSKFLAKHKEIWIVHKLNDDNSVYLEENISRPIPFMIDNNKYIAVLDQYYKYDSIISETKDDYRTQLQQDSISNRAEINKDLNYRGNWFYVGLDPFNFLFSGPTITGELFLQAKEKNIGFGILSGYRRVKWGWKARSFFGNDLLGSSYTVPLALRMYIKTNWKTKGHFIGPYMEFGKLKYNNREDELIRLYGIEYGYKFSYGYETSVIFGKLNYGTPGNWSTMFYPALSIKLRFSISDRFRVIKENEN